jgi:predicted helicase
MPLIFPDSTVENKVISVMGIGGKKDFSAIITDCIPDYQLQFNGQCFPLYWYDDSTADIADLFSQASGNEMDKYIRRDGITDWIRATARKQYGSKVDKEDIFYYVYGILHSPDYRTTFASDLKKSLPRLPLVESKEDFWAFSKAGRELAALHLNYETIEPYKGCSIETKVENYRVEKMRFGKIDSKTADKSVIHYNSAITINNIPLEAYEYVVNGKSAIEWIMERYAVTTDTKSGITNDPNDWAKEHDDEKYIYNLLLRVINVSIQTVEIVKSLPKLKFAE